MAFNLDIAIFILFLVVNLLVGLKHGKNVHNIKDYAVGNRVFSKTALVSTIVATWLSGSGFFVILSKTYSNGINYLFPYLSMVINLWIVSYFIIPRLKGFIGNLSVAESMGKVYGKNIRIISAIAGFIGSVGMVGVQFKVFGTIVNYFLGMPSGFAIVFAGFIVIIYSAFGGIKSVTYTDIVQFITFAFVMPLIGIIIWYKSGFNTSMLNNSLQQPIFQYKYILSRANPEFFNTISLAICWAIPSMDPAYYQRMIISRSIHQTKQAFNTAAFIILAVKVITFWIPLLMYSINPNLQVNQVLPYIIDNYAITGLKGMIIIGVTAMSMSTADSHLNASSILFAHDFCKPLKLRFASELVLSRLFTVVCGIAALFLALSDMDILGIAIMGSNFYMPIVTVPLLMLIFGFRSSSKSIFIGMAAGFITVIFCICYISLNALLLGMLANVIFLLASHYLLKQKGGWVGVLDPESLNQIRLERSRKIHSLINDIKQFSLIKYLVQNRPKHDSVYSFFGIFCFMTTISSIYLTHEFQIKSEHSIILHIYQTMLVISSFFMLWYMWSPRLKHPVVVGFVWHFSLIYMLVFCGSFFLLLSNFGKFELAIFTLNLIILFILTKWQILGVIIAIGIICANILYKYIFATSIIITLGSGYFNVIYALLLSSAALIAFIKPKQEQYALVATKNYLLDNNVNIKGKELRSALALKEEFIRNIHSEINNPLTSICSMSETLLEKYSNLTEKYRMEAILEIVKGSRSLESLSSNISDLSSLSNAKVDLKMEEGNISNILKEAIDTTYKIYGNTKNQKLSMKIEENLMINCNKYYISRTFSNLIINALKYCQNGNIVITLKQKHYDIQFAITDEGLGIPVKELESIFEPFKVSSKTQSIAGNRGVGLAFCKKVIELHRGKIWAENNTGMPNQKGSCFKFILPI
ncbi:MAG: ATP-binding protein [Rickettsiaceae bacterium]